MPRLPLDKTPQRVLVYDLKRAIDLYTRGPASLAVTRVRHLVAENPRSARSSHVLKNIGAERVSVLASILGEPLARPRAGGLPSDTDADS